MYKKRINQRLFFIMRRFDLAMNKYDEIEELRRAAYGFWAYQTYDLARIYVSRYQRLGLPVGGAYMDGMTYRKDLATVVPESAWCRLRMEVPGLRLNVFDRNTVRPDDPPFQQQNQ